MRFDLGTTGSDDEDALSTEVLVLDRRETEELLDMSEALKAVERAFKLEANGETIMPPKLYLDLPAYHGDFRAMPAYVDNSVGLKWVSVYPDNHRRNYPCVMAIIILSDTETGCPLAIMDGTYITSMRTGAAGGVAVKYLARRSSSVIGIVGAGVQARTQLLAIDEVLPNIEEVKVFDLYGDRSQKYAEEMAAKLNISIRPVQTIEEATEADVVVTTTTSAVPIVKKQHIRPGTHINAIGADGRGKQEMEIGVLKNAKIVVDDIEQAAHSGEINVPLLKNLIALDDIYASMGEIVAGKKRGRENDEEITVFDSTGLAIHDIICAKVVYNKARKR